MVRFSGVLWYGLPGWHVGWQQLALVATVIGGRWKIENHASLSGRHLGLGVWPGSSVCHARAKCGETPIDVTVTGHSFGDDGAAA